MFYMSGLCARIDVLAWKFSSTGRVQLQRQKWELLRKELQIIHHPSRDYPMLASTFSASCIGTLYIIEFCFKHVFLGKIFLVLMDFFKIKCMIIKDLSLACTLIEFNYYIFHLFDEFPAPIIIDRIILFSSFTFLCKLVLCLHVMDPMAHGVHQNLHRPFIFSFYLIGSVVLLLSSVLDTFIG
jgi:hypothetical protein